MRIRRRHPMPSKEVKALRDTLLHLLPGAGIASLLSGHLERGTADKYDVILSDNEPVVFTPGGDVFPTLMGFLRVEVTARFLKVDSGAVPFVANGADVMSPGIVGFDPNLLRGDLCVVTEERHNKPLSIAKMLIDAKEIDRRKKGKVAKNIHHVGDSLWKLAKQ